MTCGRVVAAAVLVTSFAHGGCVSRSLLSKGLPRRSQPDAQHLPQQRDDHTERRRSFFFFLATDVNGCENFLFWNFRWPRSFFFFFAGQTSGFDTKD